MTCKTYGWDYETFMSQPDWLLETLDLMNEIDVLNQKINTKKHGK